MTDEKVSLPISPFHALYKVRELSKYTFGRDKFLSVFASSSMEIYPYQIAAARFALRSPYLKGVILCDEGSLGKTYEAMLVIAQLWYEGKERILLVIPTPLMQQWVGVFETHFSIPFSVLDSTTSFEEHLANGLENPFIQESVVLTTYEFAAEKAESLSQVAWNLLVFEEAHHLRRVYTGNKKGALAIQKAVADRFKILLTATPMQNSIMDLYGLISFIDDTVFPDEKAFYQRYFRKPENYPELAERVSMYCFRTTRQEVENYIKIPERLLITAEFELTDKEQQLYELLDSYVQKAYKVAFPKMDKYNLALLLFRTFSSSSFAIERTLAGILQRLEILHKNNPSQLDVTSDSTTPATPTASPPNVTTATSSNTSPTAITTELHEIRTMYELSASITKDAKSTELLHVLKRGFTQLKQLGAKAKALIFTENRTTQSHLFSLLNTGIYKGKVLIYNGSCSRDYSIMERFQNEAQILISTDVGAEGFNLEFCSFVINYDLPYNTLTIDQRINRCHRQGQQSDVLIVNFLNRNNFADVRMLELINKRILQFDGIFGISDDILGTASTVGIDLSESFAKVLGNARNTREIDKIYKETLQIFEQENKRLVKTAKQSLFSSFTPEIADNLAIAPQYIEEAITKIHDDLWELTTYFFSGKHGFRLDNSTRTLSCSFSAAKVFTGTRLGRTEYSMAKDYQPRSGRHTVTGTLTKNIIRELAWKGVPTQGEVIVNAPLAPCTIAMYEIWVKPKKDLWGGHMFYSFAGKTISGEILDDSACRSLMDLPVLHFTTLGEPIGDSNRYKLSSQTPEHNTDLDTLIKPNLYIQKVLKESDSAEQAECQRLKAQTAFAKRALERNMESLHIQIKQSESKGDKDYSRMEVLEMQKKCNVLRRDLKQCEQKLFMDNLKLDILLEEALQDFLSSTKLDAKITQLFCITVKG